MNANDYDNKLLELLNESPMHRDELVEMMNSPRTTVYDHLVKLINGGYVEKRYAHTIERGRPLVFFAIAGKTYELLQE